MSSAVAGYSNAPYPPPRQQGSRRALMICYVYVALDFSRDATTYEYKSVKTLNESKYGFLGVLSRKAKSMLEDDNAPQQYEDHARSRLHMPETQTGCQMRVNFAACWILF